MTFFSELVYLILEKCIPDLQDYTVGRHMLGTRYLDSTVLNIGMYSDTVKKTIYCTNGNHHHHWGALDMQ